LLTKNQPQISKLDRINYQEWSNIIEAYLATYDLWLLIGATGAVCIDHPISAAAGAPTADKVTAICQWDTADHRAQGYLRLHITEGAVHQIMATIGTTLTAHLIWDQVQTLYGQVLPAKVYSLFQQTRHWHLDASKHPQPQIDALDYLYKQLITQTVQITDFIKVMTLLSALPPHWEEIITTQVMQAGTITDITYDTAKVAINHHWDALSARKEEK
jgi:hypothetical protein